MVVSTAMRLKAHTVDSTVNLLAAQDPLELQVSDTQVRACSATGVLDATLMVAQPNDAACARRSGMRSATITTAAPCRHPTITYTCQ
jgi:hypothetical protein